MTRGILFFVLLQAVVSTASAEGQAQSASPPVDDYVYYEYYYEDDLSASPPPPSPPRKGVTRAPVKEPTEEVADYDINELVKAWKEYIREKVANEPKPRRRTTTPAPVYDYDYYDEPLPPPRRRRPSGQRLRGQQPRPIAQYDDYECPPRSESYRTSDDSQCDKYYECNIKGEVKELLCPDGLVFDDKSQNCDYPSKVKCGARLNLQPAQPSTNCPRANGFFAWPAEESCQKFWDCRGGSAYLQICPEGVIFDMTVDSCVTPDQSKREECRAEKFLKFDCPNYSAEEPLRFGNHDRLPDPDNCQKFYSCLRDGQPRLGVCPRKNVFNNATGLCDEPKTVIGCENFWKDKEKEEFLDYYDYS